MQDEFFEEEKIQFQPIEEQKKELKKYKRSNKSIIFAIITIVIFITTIYLPWWKYNADLDYPKDYTTAEDVDDIRVETWYLDKIDIKSKSLTFGSNQVKEASKTIYYDNYNGTLSYGKDDNITLPKYLFDDSISVYKNTFILMIIVMIITIIAIIFFALNFEVLRKITIIISFSLVIIALILPIYFATVLPQAFDKDLEDRGLVEGWNKGFIGSRDSIKIPLEYDQKTGKPTKEATIKEKCSPTSGWLLALLPFFTNLLAFIFFIKPDTTFKRKDEDWHLIGKRKKIDTTKVQSSSTMLGEIASEKLFSKEEQERLYYEKVQQFPQQQQPYWQQQKEVSPLKKRIPDSGIRSAKDIFREEEDVFQIQPIPQIQEKKIWFRKKEQQQIKEESEDFEEVE